MRKETKKPPRGKPQQLPAGWDEEQVRRVLEHYENQTEDEAVAEHEAAMNPRTRTRLVAGVPENKKAHNKPNGKPKPRRPVMAVILRDIPPGYHWGWFSREDPRMHLQTVDKKNLNLYNVWLERGGRRVFEPEGKIPARVLKRIEAEVSAKRAHIEGLWTDFLIDNDWLRFGAKLPEVTLTVYPNTPNRFTRTLNLEDYFAPHALAQIRPSDMVLNNAMGALEVWPRRPEERRHHIRLSPVLWED